MKTSFESRITLQKTQEDRQANYDLLRIVATIAVIMIHVSWRYCFEINESVGDSFYTRNLIIDYTYNTLCRFAVPCFVMLSGAFILDNQRNADYRFFYEKTFKKIGIQVIVFTVIYFLYSVLLGIISILKGREEWTYLWGCIKDVLIGSPFYHMWYVYMLIGVYLLVPVVLHFKQSIDKRAFSKVAWCFLIVAMLSMWTSSHELYWDIGSSFCYLGYFMIGYEIKKYAEKKKNNKRGIILIILGIIVELVNIAVRMQFSLKGNSELVEKIITPYSPIVVGASLLIFAGFSFITIKKDIRLSKISKYTLYIYLFHAGVWNIVAKLESAVLKQQNRYMVMIPVCTFVVFLISYIISIWYTKCWKMIDRKIGLDERIGKLMRR